MKRIWFLLMVIAVMATGWVRTDQQHKSLQVKWDSMYTNQAIIYSNELYNGAIATGYAMNLMDPKQRSLAMGRLVTCPESIGDAGRIMDSMTRNGGALSAVGWELKRFVLDVWHVNFQEEILAGNQNGPSLPNTEMIKLKEIYDIYVQHFTHDVIFSQDVKSHQKALVAVHSELRQKGYEKLLRWPEMLSRAEDFDVQGW